MSNVFFLFCSGARRALPKPPSNQPSNFSTRLVPRRRQYLSPLSDDDDDDVTQQQLLRRPRKLPSIESFSAGNRLKQRFRLEDEYSTSANSTGLSVD